MLFFFETLASIPLSTTASTTVAMAATTGVVPQELSLSSEGCWLGVLLAAGVGVRVDGCGFWLCFVGVVAAGVGVFVGVAVFVDGVVGVDVGVDVGVGVGVVAGLGWYVGEG